MPLQWHNHRKCSNTHTGHKTATENVGRSLSTSLDDNAEQKDDYTAQSRQLTSKPVGEDTVDEDADPSTKFKNTIYLSVNGIAIMTQSS